jgi:hypothetical protein
LFSPHFLQHLFRSQPTSLLQLVSTMCNIYSRKPGKQYPHVKWAHLKFTFYFQLLPYPFPCVGSHMLISIIWWLDVT